ncbi:ribosomal protein S18-alanine N-acetyltransferase [cf. Phormidesmis sp. LEGE 11477]|nr:ribosomal protein S18-alanine N-acetyltransferase [cf. Phormidesmis sp. LEGE 11477]
MVTADIPAVLTLDQRCLGGLWTRSGYERELDSEHSDLLVILKSNSLELLNCRLTQASTQLGAATNSDGDRNPINRNARFTANTQIDSGAPSKPSPIRREQKIELLGVGCLWAILEEAHITTLAIDPSYQGERLGLWLLSHLLQKACDRSLTHATLEVRASNHPALSLYQKFGFEEAGRRKRYYADGEDARILWRSGLQSADCIAQINRHQTQSMRQLKQKQNYRFYPEDLHLIQSLEQKV